MYPFFAWSTAGKTCTMRRRSREPVHKRGSLQHRRQEYGLALAQRPREIPAKRQRGTSNRRWETGEVSWIARGGIIGRELRAASTNGGGGDEGSSQEYRGLGCVGVLRTPSCGTPRVLDIDAQILLQPLATPVYVLPSTPQCYLLS